MSEIYGEEYYERRGGPNYEYSSYWRNMSRLIIDILGSSPKRMCDIGCAKGYLVYEFRQMGVEAYGVDVSGYALSKAFESTKSFLRKVDLNSEGLPFPDAYFDLLTCLALVEHLTNLSHALREFNRVLKIGGKILVTTPDPRTWDFARDTDPTHVNIHDRCFWKKAFNAHGFAFRDAVPLSRGRFLRRFPCQRTLRRIAYRIRTWNNPNKGWGLGIYGFLATKKSSVKSQAGGNTRYTDGLWQAKRCMIRQLDIMVNQDPIHAAYGRCVCSAHNHIVARLKKLLSCSNHFVVLDAGCGIGEVSNEIAKKAQMVVGVDFSTEMTRFSRASSRRLGRANAEFLVCDIEIMPFIDHCFDRVVCSSVLHYMNLPSVVTTLRELKRVTKDHGLIVLRVKNSMSPQGSPYFTRPAILLRKLARSALQTVRSAKMPTTTTGSSVYYRSPFEYEALIRGLKIGSIKHRSTFGLWTGQAKDKHIEWLVSLENLLFERKLRYPFGVECFLSVEVTKST